MKTRNSGFRLLPFAFLALVVAAFMASFGPAFSADDSSKPVCGKHPPRDLLWTLVKTPCATMRDGRFVEICVADETDYKILVDVCNDADWLIIPKKEILGIEAPPAVLEDAHVSELWDHGALKLEDLLRNPQTLKATPAYLGLAINCANCRTQDQLHIHLSCPKKSVAEALSSPLATGTWTRTLPIPETSDTGPFAAYKTTSLLEVNPFKLVAAYAGAHGESMAKRGIAAISLDGGATWVIIDKPHAEGLLNENCDGT